MAQYLSSWVVIYLTFGIPRDVGLKATMDTYCKQGHMIQYTCTSCRPGDACLSMVNSFDAVRVRVAAGEGSGAVLFQANTAHKAEE